MVNELREKIEKEISRYEGLIESYHGIITDAVKLKSYTHAKNCIETVLQHYEKLECLKSLLD